MDCENWLEETHEKVFEVAKESFGGAKLASIVPDGTRAIIVWNKGSYGVTVILSCTDAIVPYGDKDVVFTPKVALDKAAIYSAISAAFQKSTQ